MQVKERDEYFELVELQEKQKRICQGLHLKKQSRVN